MRRTILPIVTVLLLAAAPAAGEGRTALERARDEADVLGQRALALAREQLAGVESLIEAERFAEAEAKLASARRIARTSDHLSADQQAALLADADRLRQLSDARKTVYLKAQREQASREIAERETQRRLAETLFAERRTASHSARLEQFRDRREYPSAMSEAKAILAAHPNDQRARGAADEMAFYAKLAAQIATRQARTGEQQLAVQEVEEASTPYTEIYRYPPVEEWEKLSIKRLRRVAQQLGYTEPSRISEVSLQKRIDLKVAEVSLGNVLTYLSEAGGVPIVADPHLEQDTGKSPNDEIVNAQLVNVTIEQILNMILPQEMGWRIDEDQIVVSSREKANPLKVITYPIQHLIAEVPDYGKYVPRMSIAEVLRTGEESGTGGGNIWEMTDTQEATTPSWERIKDLIVRFVKSSDPRVAPWEDEGGTATIEYYSGTLIVSQTEVGHRKVASLLSRL